jgi:hypothetical protein
MFTRSVNNLIAFLGHLILLLKFKIVRSLFELHLVFKIYFSGSLLLKCLRYLRFLFFSNFLLGLLLNYCKLRVQTNRTYKVLWYLDAVINIFKFAVFRDLAIYRQRIIIVIWLEHLLAIINLLNLL